MNMTKGVGVVAAGALFIAVGAARAIECPEGARKAEAAGLDQGIVSALGLIGDKIVAMGYPNDAVCEGLHKNAISEKTTQVCDASGVCQDQVTYTINEKFIADIQDPSLLKNFGQMTKASKKTESCAPEKGGRGKSGDALKDFFKNVKKEPVEAVAFTYDAMTNLIQAGLPYSVTAELTKKMPKTVGNYVKQCSKAGAGTELESLDRYRMVEVSGIPDIGAAGPVTSLTSTTSGASVTSTSNSQGNDRGNDHRGNRRGNDHRGSRRGNHHR